MVYTPLVYYDKINVSFIRGHYMQWYTAKYWASICCETKRMVLFRFHSVFKMLLFSLFKYTKMPLWKLYSYYSSGASLIYEQTFLAEVQIEVMFGGICSPQAKEQNVGNCGRVRKGEWSDNCSEVENAFTCSRAE